MFQRHFLKKVISNMQVFNRAFLSSLCAESWDPEPREAQEEEEALQTQVRSHSLFWNPQRERGCTDIQSRMSRWVRPPAFKTDSLSLIPRTHMAGGENQPPKTVLQPVPVAPLCVCVYMHVSTCMHMYTRAHTHTNK